MKGSIQQLGPKKFKVRAQSRDARTGRKVSRGKTINGTRAQALRELDELKRRAREGAKPRRLKLRAYATSWIASRAQMVKAGRMKPSVLRKYATGLDLHILPILGDRYVDTLTHADVEDYVTGRIASGEASAGNTVLNELRLIRTIARDSFAAGVAPRYWADRVKPPEVHVYDEDDPNALEGPQLMKVLAKIPPQWLRLFAAMAFTGLRWGEASALRWEDLDHAAGIIRVQRGNWKGQAVSAKTKKSRRKIPIPPYLVPPKPNATGYIFPTRAGTLHKGTPLNKVITKACAAAGVPRVTPHGLRRTYKDLLDQVTDAAVAKALMGWTTDAMASHYSTVRADRKHLAARKVLELVGLTPPPLPRKKRRPDGAQMEHSDESE